jgi:hypothetical protein
MYVCIVVYSLLNDHFLSQRDLIYKYIAEVIYSIGEKNAEGRGLMVGIGIFSVHFNCFNQSCFELL